MLTAACDLCRGPLGDDATPRIARLRPHVENPVRFRHDIEVVLDHDRGVARADQSVQHLDQFLDVRHVQPDRRLIEHVEGVARPRARTASDLIAYLRQLGHELDALSLAARERRARLAERQVAEAHVLEQPEGVVHAAMCGKEARRIIDVHGEHIADAGVAPAYRERLGVEAPPAAHITQHLDIGQEAHLDGAHALPRARFAAAAGGVEREAAGAVAAHPGLGGSRIDAADLVPEAEVGRRTGARWLADRCLVDLEHAIELLESLQRFAADERGGGGASASAAGGNVGGETPPQVGVQHIARQRGLARARDARDDHQPSERYLHITAPDVVQRDTRARQARGGRVHRTMRSRRMQQRLAQEAPGGRARVGGQILHRAGTDELAAAHARLRTEVEHVIGAADGLLVVLDHHQRVAMSGQLGERIEQDLVVARVQADRGLVQHVAHALQVRAHLRGETDALRLTARERRCGAIELQVTEPDALEELQPRANLGQQIAGDRPLARPEPQPREELCAGGDRVGGERGDRAPAEAYAERGRVETLPLAVTAGLGRMRVPLVPPQLLTALLLVEPGHLDAGAVAALAPAVPGIEREQPWIELGEALTAGRTGAARGEDRDTGALLRQHVYQALAEIERAREAVAQGSLVLHAHIDLGHRQLDGVLAEARQARPGRGRQPLAIDPQSAKALLRGPPGEVGVVALARDDERREQRDAPAAVVPQQPRRDRRRALRLDGDIAIRAVLRTELHVQQAQKMIDLGERRHGALAATAAGALLDGDGRRDAEDRVHVGARRRLHELPRIGVERLEVTALSLAEKDVEGECRLAGARDTGDHGETVARDLDVDVLEVVLACLVDHHRARVAPVAAAVVRGGLRDAAHGQRRPGPVGQ